MPKKQTHHYDVIVIGAGPAGYASAIRCAQLGLKTPVLITGAIKRDKVVWVVLISIGGCIASMTLLESAKIYHQLRHEINKTRYSG